MPVRSSVPRLARLARLALVLALAACGPHARAPAAPSSSPALSGGPSAKPALVDSASVRAQADAWRAAHRLIDLHTHVDPTPEHMAQAVRVMDAIGVGLAVDLSGGTVTRDHGEASAFERTKKFADQRFPGRFLEYMNLDFTDWDAPDFAANAVAQVEEGSAASAGRGGSRSSSAWGSSSATRTTQLLKIDDPRLDPMWQALGRLGMPVSIHVADPKAFWGPYDATNERWTELKDHPRWWFGDPKVYPPREELLAELERVVARHPETTFVCVHFGNNAEDLDWVDAQLDRHPNMMVDIAASRPREGDRWWPPRSRASARILREAPESHPLRDRLPELRPDDARLGR